MKRFIMFISVSFLSVTLSGQILSSTVQKSSSHRVWVKTISDPVESEGWIYRVDNFGFTFLPKNISGSQRGIDTKNELMMKFDQVEYIQYKKKKKMVKVMMIGGAAGAALGSVLTGVINDCRSWCLFSTETSIALGGATGFVIGSLLTSLFYGVIGSKTKHINIGGLQANYSGNLDQIRFISVKIPLKVSSD